MNIKNLNYHLNKIHVHCRLFVLGTKIYFWKPFVNSFENPLKTPLRVYYSKQCPFFIQELELVVFTFKNGPVPGSNSSRVLFWNRSGSGDSSRLPRPLHVHSSISAPLTRHSDNTYHHITTRLWRLTGVVTCNQDASASCSAEADPRPDQTSTGLERPHHHPSSHTGNNYCI